MELLKLSIPLFFLTASVVACNGLISSGKSSPNGGAGNSANASGNTPGSSGSSSSTGSSNPSVDQLIDTSKLKEEMNGLMNSIATGKDDTTQLKKTAADIMNTTATILSDSGISALGGNSNDPSQTSAKETLKKMRDGMGITPGKLDSMRKAAAQLNKN